MPLLRAVGAPRAATREDQLNNLALLRKHKEGRINALKWAQQNLQFEIDREFKKLQIIEEDLTELTAT